MQRKNRTFLILEEVIQHSLFLNKTDEALQENPEMSIQKICTSSIFTSDEAAVTSVSNPGTLLMLLYGLIVFPWERLRKEFRRDPVLRKTRLADWCTFHLFNLAPSMQRKPILLYFTLELMRNAISHANVRIEDNLQISFRDRQGTILAFEYEQLKVFLDKLIAFYQSHRLE